MYCTPLRKMFSIPPPCSSGLSSAEVSTSRNFACDPAAFSAFSYAGFWVASSHANRSSGNSARSRSYPVSSVEYSHPWAARYSQISDSKTTSL